MNFYVLDENSVQIGPFTALELQEKGLQPKAQVRSEIMSEWVDADSIDALKFIFDPSIPVDPTIANPVETSEDASSTQDQLGDENADAIEDEAAPNEQASNEGGQTKENNEPSATSTIPVAYVNPAAADGILDSDSYANDTIHVHMNHTFTDELNVAVCVLLHFLTCGLFTFIYCGLKFDNLPKTKTDDFGAGKAIGFMFIPLFNLYWRFMFWQSLAERINLQYQLRGQRGPVSTGLATAYCIIMLIPYVNIFVAVPIIAPILFAQIQSATNGLVRMKRFETTN